MKTFADLHFSLYIPEEWADERHPECVSLCGADGIGELQISASRRQDPITISELRELAAEHIDAGAITEQVRFGDFEGFTFSYGVEDEYWREWYLRSGSLLLFVTYCCDAEDEGKEDDVVEAILETLSAEQTSPD